MFWQGLRLALTFSWMGPTWGVNWEHDFPFPPDLVPFFFNNHPDLAKECLADELCPYKQLLHKGGCWGYEDECPAHKRYSIPSCPGHHGDWVQSKDEQLKLFFSQGDFGYVKDRRREMANICIPQTPEESSLQCTGFLRFCHGRNLLFDFHNLLTIEQPMRYRTDVLSEGQVGGRCELNIDKLEQELGHNSPLQSWAPELGKFSKFGYIPISDRKCDVVLDKPTFLMKLDATVNMYHHFCDFINLYLSQHMNNSFSKDIQILIWDMMPYHSNFGVMWKAFTNHPVLDLKDFAGKRVCFRDVIFSFLPRMIFGMYYNMPLVSGCEQSGFFRAFSHLTLHRLGITQEQSARGKIRVTVLSRETTYRKILNENELLLAASTLPDVEVQQVVYRHQIPFLHQLNRTHNTDIFIGMHGAGLAHLLFLPDWAVVFELYNCEDEPCYRDLARLRGVKYLTWQKKESLFAEDQGKHPTLGAHAKFTNYRFAVDEFLHQLREACQHVRNHPLWQHSRFHRNIHEEL